MDVGAAKNVNMKITIEWLINTLCYKFSVFVVLHLHNYVYFLLHLLNILQSSAATKSMMDFATQTDCLFSNMVFHSESYSLVIHCR